MKKKNLVISISLFAIVAIVMALIIPTSGMFKYDFAQGEEWSNKTLVAPFDFPISKSTAEQNTDKVKFDQRYINVYQQNKNVPTTNLDAMRLYFGITEGELNNANYNSLSSNRKAIITAYKTIEYAHMVGIIAIYQNNTNNNVSFVRIITDDKINTQSTDKLYTVQKTKDHIKKSLSKQNLKLKDSNLLLEIEQFIGPNITYDESLDKQIRRQEESKISTTKGFVSKGRIIIRKGEVVDAEKYAILRSFKREYMRRGGRDFSILPFLGNILYILLVMTVSYFSIRIFHRQFYDSIRNVLFLLFLYLFSVIGVVILSEIDYTVSIYILPFAIIPFYINNFFNARIANYQYIFILLIVSLAAPSAFEFLFVNYLAGLVGIYSLQRSYMRNKFIGALTVTIATYLATYTIMNFIQNGTTNELFRWTQYVWFIINSVLFIALYQLLFIVEKVFGFISTSTLFELSDTNQKLLRDLGNEAPGTYQHTIQVANLTESACKAIGANPLLGRTGALYHDIGKMKNPLMFIENNSGESLHNKLTPIKSAEIIKEHVTEGIRLARKYKLPEEVVQFITSHHGDSIIYFFYKAYKNEHMDEDIDMSLFQYAGPKPISKEVSICMMADAIEAASRTLKEYNTDSISNLVENIVKHQIDGGQFAKSQLTFNELEIVKEAFKNKIATIYHSRIEYPK